MDAALNFALFLGTILLLGAGVFGRYIGPELINKTVSTYLRWGLVLGALLLASATLVDVLSTLIRAVGGLYLDVLWEYLIYTRHGLASFVRLEIVVILLALGVGQRLPEVRDRIGHSIFGLGLLATFSWISHAGASGDMSLVVADIVHLVASTAWAGSIVYLAWLPVWSKQQDVALLPAVQRMSAVGLLSVLLLIATGVYASFAHLFGVSALATTAYGRALLYKHILIVIILMIAGANRWFLLPSFARNGASMSLVRFMKLESLTLVGVLALTGLLTTREPAHGLDHSGMSNDSSMNRIVSSTSPCSATLAGCMNRSELGLVISGRMRASERASKAYLPRPLLAITHSLPAGALVLMGSGRERRNLNEYTTSPKFFGSLIPSSSATSTISTRSKATVSPPSS